MSRVFRGQYVGDELRLKRLNGGTLTTAELRHHDIILFLSNSFKDIDCVLFWPDKRFHIEKSASGDASLYIDESVSAEHVNAMDFFDLAFQKLAAMWRVVPYVTLKPTDQLIQNAFYPEELDNVVKVTVEWADGFLWFYIYYHWSSNLYPVQGPLLINVGICSKSKLKLSRLRFIQPSVMIVVAGEHGDIENIYNNTQFWRQWPQSLVKISYLVSVPGRQGLSTALKIFGLFSDARTITHNIRLQCERLQCFTSLPDRCFSNESLSAPQVWDCQCEHRPPFLTSLLVDLMLIFRDIPLYVLLEIADWLPYMFVYSRVKKVQTLERTRKSIQRVLKARDAIYKRTRSKTNKTINI